eukprot:TRINITY_DN15226_c0_g1_i1.p1 TRINITY_DN15226_c0_g1~~TRINITY_DN15226_c0_g1_i1.p1  ORF type:complete len:555 (+),score=92.22 TRINITY_DN15226_c0_g1_i1:37-1701(+)
MLRKCHHGLRYFTTMNPTKPYDLEGCSPDDLTAAVTDALQKCSKATSKVKNVSKEALTWTNTAVPIIQVNQLLQHTMRTVETVAAFRGEEFNDAYSQSITNIAQQLSALSSSKEVCSSLQKLLGTMPFEANDISDPEERERHHILLSLCIQFSRNGSMLDESNKKMFDNNRSEISIFKSLFEANMTEATSSPEFKDYEQIITSSEDRTERRELYEKYVARASTDEFDNQANLHKILLLRKQRAALLGHDSYAELMFSKAGERHKLLETAHSLMLPAAMKEIEELKKISGYTEIHPWDMPHLMTKQQVPSIDASFSDFINALCTVTSRSFGVELVVRDANQPLFGGHLKLSHTISFGDRLISILSADRDLEYHQVSSNEAYFIVPDEYMSGHLLPFEIRQLGNLFGEALLSVMKKPVGFGNRTSCAGSFMELCMEDYFKLPTLYPANHAVRELVLAMLDFNAHYLFQPTEETISVLSFCEEQLREYSAIPPSSRDCSVCNTPVLLSGASSHLRIFNKFTASELPRDVTLDVETFYTQDRIPSPKAFIDRLSQCFY